MARCDNCGKSGFTVTVIPCAHCGRKACTNCQREYTTAATLGQRVFRYNQWAVAPAGTVRMCSEKCLVPWLQFVAPYYDASSNTATYMMNNVAWVATPMGETGVRLRALQHLSRAKNYEVAMRYEDAAKEYEAMGMWKEAGEVRRSGFTTMHTTKSVEVDVNRLIDQMRQGGISTEYRCPKCGGTIQITSAVTAESLRFCNFCGTAIETTNLAQFLKGILK